MLSYGEYARIHLYCSAILGLPHSSNSPTVSGSDSSSMVFITSTNGTCASTPLNRSGRRFMHAPIRSPPALPPWITSPSLRATFCRISSSPQAMKSVKVFILFFMRPASCQVSPNSPPPRHGGAVLDVVERDPLLHRLDAAGR